MGRYESCTYFDVLYDATEKCFPNIDRQNARTVLREVLLAPDDYTVEFSNQTLTKPQLMDTIAQALIASCIEGTPQQTYIEFVEQAAETIKHMNDGFISDNDYAERQKFLQKADQYEFSLFSAYCLLMTAHSENQEQLDEILLNIIRLREIDDLITIYTRDEKGIETDREEFERAKPIYRMLKSLQTLGYDYNFSPKERESLGIDHEDDNDLSNAFNHENWLKRIMLLRLRQEMAEIGAVSTVSAPTEYEPAHSSNEEISNKIAQLRGTFNKRGFDKNRFIMLENSKTPLTENGENIN